MPVQKPEVDHVIPLQWDALMNFIEMEGNTCLITGQGEGPHGKADVAAKWILAATYVNRFGQCQKNVDGWREVRLTLHFLGMGT